MILAHVLTTNNVQQNLRTYVCDVPCVKNHISVKAALLFSHLALKHLAAALRYNQCFNQLGEWANFKPLPRRTKDTKTKRSVLKDSCHNALDVIRQAARYFRRRTPNGDLFYGLSSVHLRRRRRRRHCQRLWHPSFDVEVCKQNWDRFLLWFTKKWYLLRLHSHDWYWLGLAVKSTYEERGCRGEERPKYGTHIYMNRLKAEE